MRPAPPLRPVRAGAIVDYLGRNQKAALGQLGALRTYSTRRHMVLDPQTRRNLELFEGGRWGDAEASLISVLDKTGTAMGGRLLRRWLGQPLLDIQALERRLDAVEWHHRSALRRGRVTSLLGKLSDMERLVNRVRGEVASPRDLARAGREPSHGSPDPRRDGGGRGRAAGRVGRAQHIPERGCGPANRGGHRGRSARSAWRMVASSRRGSRLSSTSCAARPGRRGRTLPAWRARSGSAPASGPLKVGYNRVFGYYIEVSKANADAVPEEYIRRQTLVGGERYITPEMKEYEAEVLSADERILELEASLFQSRLRADRRVRRADPRDGGRGRENGRLRIAGRGRVSPGLRQAQPRRWPGDRDQAGPPSRRRSGRCPQARSYPTTRPCRATTSSS